MKQPVNKLRAKRVSKRWTLDQLAEMAGVARSTVVRAEKGVTPKVETRRRLAEALGVQPHELWSFWAE